MEHVDEWAGFALERPIDWDVRVANGIVTVRREPAGWVAAFFWPLRSEKGVEDVARQFVAWARQNNSTFEAWRKPGEEVILRTRAQREGRTLEGAFTVTEGLIAGFHAPTEEWEANAPILAHIVSTFRSVPVMPRSLFRDPTEGAFTALVPKGWQAQGAVRRDNMYGAGMPTFQASCGMMGVTSPVAHFFFQEGFFGLPMMGGQSLPYAPAPKWAEQWVTGWARQQFGAIKVERIIERPDLVPLLAIEVAKAGIMPETCELSAAMLQFAYTQQGTPMRQRIAVMVQRQQMGFGIGAGGWVGALAYAARAPLAEFDRVEPVLTGVLESIKPHPPWEQMELSRCQQMSLAMQQDSLRRIRQISQTLSETSDIITSGYWQRQQVHDRLSHDWSNAILGRTDVLDSYGTVYNVPDHHYQYWKDPQGYVYGTGMLFNPDPTWTKLEPLR